MTSDNKSIEVTSAALNKLAAAIADRNQANQQLSVKLEGEVLQNFGSEGGEFGNPWVPLKLSTILARLRGSPKSNGAKAKAKGIFKAGGTSKQAFAASGAGLIKILQDTGALRQSFAGFFTPDEAGVGARSNAAHADLSIVHEFGDPSRNIPARPMLPPPDLALEWAIEVYQNHIAQARQSANL
jgi:phage gpG-like protein